MDDSLYLLSKFLNMQYLKNNSTVTIECYSLFCGKYIDFLHFQNNTITSDSYYAFIAYLKSHVNAVSVRTYCTHIRVFLNYLYRNKFIDWDPMLLILPKAPPPLVDILTFDKISKLYYILSGNDFYNIRNSLIVSFMLDCGLRASEVIHLTLSCIRDGYIVVLGKGNKKRVIPYGSKTEQYLKRWQQFRPTSDRSELLLDRSGKALERTVFNKMFRNFRKISGIVRLHPHLLRHTFATYYLIYNRGSIYDLSIIMGHSSVKTTEIYLHYASNYLFLKEHSFSLLDTISDASHSL